MRDNEAGCPGYVAEEGDVAKWTVKRARPRAQGPGPVWGVIEEDVLRRTAARRAEKSAVAGRSTDPGESTSACVPIVQAGAGRVGRRVERPRVRACG